MKAIWEPGRHIIRRVRRLGATVADYLAIKPLRRIGHVNTSSYPCPVAGLAGRNGLPTGIALRYIRVIASRIGTIVPSLRGRGLAIVIVAVVRIVIPAVGISIVGISIETEPYAAYESVVPHAEAMVHTGEAAVKSAKSSAMEAAKPAAMKPTALKPTALKPTAVKPTALKPTALKPTAKAAAVESSTPAAAMRAGVGESWQTERGSAQQSGSDGQ